MKPRIFALVVLIVLGVGLSVRQALWTRTLPPAPAETAGVDLGLSGLPVSVQARVSAAIGADDPAYRVVPGGGRWQAGNPAQRLDLSFDGSEVHIYSGRTLIGLGLREIGYGRSLRELKPVEPIASANHVTYTYPGVSEWYTNGPLGLEQGFTISRAPDRRAAGSMTIALELSGKAHGSLADRHRSLVLTDGGRVALRYSGLEALDARGHTLPAALALAGNRLLLHIDTRHARYPLRVDPFLQQGEKLLGGGETGKAIFGVSVALSSDGSAALIGAPFDNSDHGAAWVFTRSGSTWSEQTKLTGGGEVGMANFGKEVALSSNGNTALIGGPDDTGGPGLGAAWVFTRSGSTWTQQAKLTVTGGSNFGTGLALSSDGNTAVIGSPSDTSGKGAAWVFTRSGTTWAQQGSKLTGTEEVGAAEFGDNLALSADGTTAIIDGPHDNELEGAAWVFTHSGSAWTQQGKKLAGGEEVPGGGEFGGGEFGDTAALSSDGNTAAIGGPHDNGLAGAVWMFTRSGSEWKQQGPKLTGGFEHTFFGDGLALTSDGNQALVGSPEDNVAGVGGEGTSSVLTRSGETWSQQGSRFTGGGETDYVPFEGAFGVAAAVSADGSTGLIGGPGDNNHLGAAWVFTTTEVAQPPAATTVVATSVAATTATLNATVNPDGTEVTKCLFEYGDQVTVAYGTRAPCAVSPGSGSSPVSVSAAVSGLAQNSTYHFRIVAENAEGGIDYGSDRTFTTAGVSPPSVLKLKPTAGPVGGGTKVTIAGTNFTTVTAVRFGSLAASNLTVISTTTISAVSPAEGAGTVDVTVTTSGGTSGLSSKDHYKFTPTITSVKPTSGSTTGGTSVTVTGSGFAVGSTATVLKFGTSKATGVSCSSSTECKAVSPAHAAGKVDVGATVNKAASPKAAADQFTYT